MGADRILSQRRSSESHFVRRRRWRAAIAVGLILGSPNAWAAGDLGTPVAAEEQAQVVLVVDPSTHARFSTVIDAARANLAGQGVQLSVLRLSEAVPGSTLVQRELKDGVVGVFWLDDSQPGALRVLLQTREHGRFARTIATPEMDEATVEEAVWLIVRSNSLALAMGTRPAMEPEPEPESEPEPSEPQVGDIALQGVVHVVSPPRAVEVGGSYAGGSVGRRLPWQHGLELDATFHTDRAWIVGAAASLAFPAAVSVPLQWQQAIELRAGIRTQLGERVELRGLGNVGVGALQWINADAGTKGWRATVNAGLDAGLIVRLVGRVQLWFAPGVVATLNRFPLTECSLDTDTCTGEGRRVVFEAWPVQPRIRAGLRFSMGGVRRRR